MTAGEHDGSAFLIDPDKLGLDGWRILGGIEALNAVEMTIKRIREKSTNVQERVFLAEIASLLRACADQDMRRLAALATETGAGELQQAPPRVVN